MNNSLKCKSLFSFIDDFISDILTKYEYPWEVIRDLKINIERITKNGLDGYTRLSDNVLIGVNVQIADSACIDGPCIIGHGAVIRHGAYIRGNVILGEGATLGNSSEAKNSIMMKGAQAPHFNYIGDSILGIKAHLGAGAICSNLRSDGQNVRIKLDGKSVETGMRKLGAILGDGVEVGCGAVLCPGTIIGKNTIVYPLTMTRGYYTPDTIIKKDGSLVPHNK
jgi:NDP-sugar pyrophosphorylase family protein